MKKSIYLFISTIMVTLTLGCSESSEPVLDKHYSALPTDLSSLISEPVVEVFSLTCGHCKAMEEHLPAIEQASGLDVGKIHVTFNKSAQDAAIFYYTAAMQLNGEMDAQIVGELFNAFQMSNDATPEQRKNAVELIYSSRGLTSPYELNQDQQKQLFKAMDIAIKTTDQGKISSVPTFIVAGKYIVNTSAHESTADMAETIKFLANK